MIKQTDLQPQSSQIKYLIIFRKPTDLNETILEASNESQLQVCIHKLKEYITDDYTIRYNIYEVSQELRLK